MPPKSTIIRLPPEIRAEVDRLIREGAATTDEIVAALRELGAETSRSAVGRYAK